MQSSDKDLQIILAHYRQMCESEGKNGGVKAADMLIGKVKNSLSLDYIDNLMIEKIKAMNP